MTPLARAAFELLEASLDGAQSCEFTQPAALYARAAFLLWLSPLVQQQPVLLGPVPADTHAQLAALAEARAEFERLHPPCPHCGHPLPVRHAYHCPRCRQPLERRKHG